MTIIESLSIIVIHTCLLLKNVWYPYAKKQYTANRKSQKLFPVAKIQEKYGGAVF